MFDRRMQSSVEEEQALWDCGRTGCCPCRTKSLEIVLKVSKDDWPESLLVILGSLYTSLLLTYATSYACRDLWTSIPKLRSATKQPISRHLNRFKGGFHFLFSGRVKPGVCYHLVKLGRPSECSGRNCSLDVVTSVSAWTRHRKMTSHLSHFQWYDVQLWVGVHPHFSRSGLTVVKEETFIFGRDSYKFSLAACHRHREEVHSA